MTSNVNITTRNLYKSVYIVGLGWLGLPLLKYLQTKEYEVSGTVSSKEKQQQLHIEGFDVDSFQLYLSLTKQYPKHCPRSLQRFKNACMVLNIPPGRENFDKTKYVLNVIGLIDLAIASGLKRLIFISTTSVYGSATGIISNNSQLSPRTESGKAHYEIESYLTLKYPEHVKILRPTGLIGPNNDGSLRHPIFTLCHKKNITNGRDPVNLVHQFDVIQAISKLIEMETTKVAYNLAAFEHPSRDEYYCWCAKQLNLPKPDFIDDSKKRPLGKLIDASNTYQELGFKPHYASPFEML